MRKHLLSFSLIFLGVCILLGAWIIPNTLEYESKVNPRTETLDQQYRYEFISANETNIIIFDKQTGEYWRKFIETNGGPTNWEKEESPVPSTE